MGRPHSIPIALPPLGGLILVHEPLLEEPKVVKVPTADSAEPDAPALDPESDEVATPPAD